MKVVTLNAKDINRIHRLIAKSSIGLLTLAALMWAAPAAQAGAIRYAGKMIMQGTNAAAAAAASGGESAAGKATGAAQATGGVLHSALGATGNAVRSAGKDAGDAVVLGASATVWGARQAPGIVARKTSAAARGFWHAIW